MPYLDQISGWTGVPANVLWVLGCIFVALVIGSIVRFANLHSLPQDKAHSLLLRLRSWWIIALVLALVIVLGRPAIVGLFLLASLLGLREYMAMVPERDRYGQLVWWAYGAAVLHYTWIYFGLVELILIFIPVLVFLALTMRVVTLRQPERFVHTIGTLHWGLMMYVFCLSHVAVLLLLPDGTNPVGGGVGWFLYLVLLTELNDIVQALVGRPLGRHKIIPEISPGKSWEGLIGGMLCTVVVAILLAPVLTPFGAPYDWSFETGLLPVELSPWAVGAAVFISLGGFCGDIAVSAVKRGAHVKDSGALLPGQGGVLDRVDSLTFTAPLFVYYLYFLYLP